MDFAAIAAKDPNVRLDAVFEIAYKELGIERLLDPEGEYDCTVLLKFQYILYCCSTHYHRESLCKLYFD